jgi:acyl-CoA synthetase (NDP forming)
MVTTDLNIAAPGSTGIGPQGDAARAADLVRRAVASGAAALGEWEAKSLLAAYGVPVPAGALAMSEADAVAVAERLGGKLAMKAVGSGIHHKTEGGLVVLGVSGADAVAETYRLLRERAGGALEGVIVERMVAGNRELLAGVKRDPVFGPVVAFGLGGVLTEVLGDIALALVPPSARDVAQLLESIRSKRILGAFRGSPPVERAALGKVIEALAQIALDFPEIAEIDVNPLMIEGDQPVAADALVILSSEVRLAPEPRAFAPDLRAVLTPESVAIVGASDDIRKWGGSALRNLLDGGYKGTIYPVSPRGGVFFGLEAYTSIADLPEAPDLALMAVGGHQVKGVLEECGRRGMRAVVVLAAGFSETGDEGAALEREILQIAAQYGITLIGPNCMGLMSNEKAFHATGFVAVHPPRGKLSFISQSGSLGPGVVNTCERRGIGVEKFISVGNEAQVSAFDVLDYMRDDPATECVMMYLEGIENGAHFVEAARRATAVKPVVVLRGGLTEVGGQAAASHTGAMAGSAAVFRAAARQSGVVICGTVDELVDLGASLADLPLPRGRLVAVVTNGGGPGVLAADEVALNGLELAELPQDLVHALDQLLPPFWSRRNPLDLVAMGFGDVGLRVIEHIARCDAVDAILALSFIGVPNTGDEGRERSPDGVLEGFSPWEMSYMELCARLMEETGKPIINVPDHPVHATSPTFGRYSSVVLSSPRAAARVLDAMASYGRYKHERYNGKSGSACTSASPEEAGATG